MCNNTDTLLTRDNITRLQFVECKICGSKRSVMSIKSGFRATSKADRKAVKNSGA
jgi:translation initiation factor 2 subunit 2